VRSKNGITIVGELKKKLLRIRHAIDSKVSEILSGGFKNRSMTCEIQDFDNTTLDSSHIGRHIISVHTC